MRRGFLVLATVCAVAAEIGCGNGEKIDDCCVCNPGWEIGADFLCSACADGYVMDSTGNVCSNGRDGAPCQSNLNYPYWGCTHNGYKLGDCKAGGVFPCVCSTGNCDQEIADLQTNGHCYPKGTRMYTPFPNQPIKDMDFSLTFVGCDLTADDTYAVIPAFNEDLTEENPCSELPITSTAGIECERVNGQRAVINETCSSFLLKQLSPSGVNNKGMTEYTFQPLVVQEGGFRGTLDQRAAANNKEFKKDTPIFEKETYFRVCKLISVEGKSGMEKAWAEVANHDHGVKERDFIFKISKEALYDPRGAASDLSGDGPDCCDGLKLGPACLPLWAFLLLWLLMAFCLGGMGYMLHKNKNEIEAQKNNEKYEKFNVDAEMSAMAARQAEEDDDI
ncbi:hypothetical protein DIPPA_22315 [Diplonema papillatum]|nr:hypothetical protein DIPPA_22315 [Diplonema papillatum]